MFSGLWAPVLSILAYVALKALTEIPATIDVAAYDIQTLAMIYVPLAVLHRIGTTYAVLGTPILKDDIARDPKRYLYVPLAIVAGCVLVAQGFAFHSAFSFMPSLHGQLWAFFALAYVMVLWERWHFCAQEFGVLSIYRMRAGQRTAADKKFDRFYTVVLMLGVNMVLFTAWGFPDVKVVLLYGTPLASASPELLQPVATCAFGLGMVLVAVAVIREWTHPQRSVPKALFYLLIGAHTLLLYAFPKAIGLFFLSYTFHHWMVAVGLFGRVTMRSYGDVPLRARITKLALGVGPFLAVALLAYWAFGPLNKAGNLAPVPDAQLFEGISSGAKIFVGVVVGLFFALNYLHYYYDRCLYAFSSKAVRENVAPLLLGSPTAGR